MTLSILKTIEFQKLIKNNINKFSKIEIFSAYIKLDALKIITKRIRDNTKITLIAKWAPYDLISGASDLEVYEYCKKRDWKFGIDQSLHVKIYAFDRKNIMLGSNNLTLSGLGLTPSHNIEAGLEMIEPTIEDFNKIDSLYSNVTWIDDDIYNKIKGALNTIKNYTR